MHSPLWFHWCLGRKLRHSTSLDLVVFEPFGALEEDGPEEDGLEDDVLEDGVLEDDVLEDDGLEEDELEDDVLEDGRRRTRRRRTRGRRTRRRRTRRRRNRRRKPRKSMVHRTQRPQTLEDKRTKTPPNKVDEPLHFSWRWLCFPSQKLVRFC